MKTLVTVFSHERLYHLKLCLEFLEKATQPKDGHEFVIIVVDDNSEDPELREWLTEQLDSDRIHSICVPDTSKIEGVDHYTRGYRLAIARHEAIELFMHGDANYLLMLDDDIIVGPSTLYEALADFERLKSTKFFKPGALSLHALVSHHSFTIFPGQTYAELKYSGEANCIFDREAIKAVGNHYKPEREGFADHQFAAMIKSGYNYLTRIEPSYAVQHIGYGKGGSAIYRPESHDPLPFWTTRPYQVFHTHAQVPLELTSIFGHREKAVVDNGIGMTNPVQVPGFDIAMYDKLVQAHGGNLAAKYYLTERTIP